MENNRYKVRVYKYPVREMSVYKQRHIAFIREPAPFPCSSGAYQVEQQGHYRKQTR